MSLAFLEQDNRKKEWVIAMTLGHNSSVLLAKSDGHIIAGFEEERLTKHKSDSSFPVNALEKCLEKIVSHSMPKKPIIINVGISHWFNQTFPCASWNRYYLDVEKFITKFFDIRSTISIVKRVEFDFNHHQMHLDSIKPFVKANITNEQKNEYGNKKTIAFVADGFGNREEVLTLLEYDTLNGYLSNDQPSAKYKLNNLNYSLGLLYQYITSSVGMIENQDEYKFLGYESHIQSIVSNKNLLDEKIDKIVEHFKIVENPIKWASQNDFDQNHDSTNNSPINLEKLKRVKDFYHSFSKECIEDFIKNDQKFVSNCELNKKKSIRTLMGFILQQSVEKIVLNIFKNYLQTHNILTAGGLFYNVKLNNRIMTNCKNLYCVMPLAGDQGCSIGVLDNILQEQYHTPVILDRLNFGKRGDIHYTFTTEHVSTIANEISSKNGLNLDQNVIKNIVEYTINHVKFSYTIEDLSKILNSDSGLVNLVYSDMEFGPRALCFTTTLARPTEKNVEIINDLNDRDTVMPMAPVMLKKNDTYFFEQKEISRVVGSDRYMILTYIYKDEINQLRREYGGVMHKVQNENFDSNIKYSGRPQFLYQTYDNPIVFELLQRLEQETGVKALINTSYNVHGTPIVYDAKDAIDNFVYQVLMKFYKNIERELYLFVGI